MGSDDDVPRLPRGRGLKLNGGELTKIGMTAALLVAVIVMARPCGDAAGNFVGSFDQPPVAADAAAPPATTLPPGDYTPLRADMTDDEIRKAVEENRARAAAAATMDAGTDATPDAAR